MKDFTLPQHFFLLLLSVVTVAFVWILLPFSGAIFWGAVLAIVFAPLHNRLKRRLGERRNLAAILSLFLIVVAVILPVALVGSSLVDQATSVFTRVNVTEINFAKKFDDLLGRLPSWAISWLERHEAEITATLDAQFKAGIAELSDLAAAYAVNVGRNALDFAVSIGVMLYLLFFLFRDGPTIAWRIQRAAPLRSDYKRALFAKFVTVIRATVKGNVLVAMTQGALGGLIFWLFDIPGPVLWGVVMTFLSLLPAVGAAIVWGPVALYYLFTGAFWPGVLLGMYGVLVIGLVDNVLRPILVGKDTKLPDYLVLLSTLGGMALLGLNGFVIGPAIAAMFVAAWDLFASSEEFHAEPSSQQSKQS